MHFCFGGGGKGARHLWPIVVVFVVVVVVVLVVVIVIVGVVGVVVGCPC